MIRTATCLAALLAGSPVVAIADEAPPLSTDDEKTLYAVGLVISRGLAQFELGEGELAIVQAGIADGALGREPKVELDVFGPKIEGLLQRRAEARAGAERSAGAEFLVKAAAEPGAQTTDSGLVYLELEPGSGESPAAVDEVTLHYHGTLRDGTVFDSSREGADATPATFALNRVIPCFSEGLQKMKVGGTSRLTCPSDLAYGERGSPPAIPPGAALQFEVELIGITPEASADEPAPAEEPAVPTP
jgi:FKBP-type peptidyl-prolyl cis-trans isomerase FkpA/FKBP-type peptidyl-prolyl cis-trans isomerase FklB